MHVVNSRCYFTLAEGNEVYYMSYMSCNLTFSCESQLAWTTFLTSSNINLQPFATALNVSDVLRDQLTILRVDRTRYRVASKTFFAYRASVTDYGFQATYSSCMALFADSIYI